MLCAEFKLVVCVWRDQSEPSIVGNWCIGRLTCFAYAYCFVWSVRTRVVMFTFGSNAKSAVVADWRGEHALKEGAARGDDGKDGGYVFIFCLLCFLGPNHRKRENRFCLWIWSHFHTAESDTFRLVVVAKLYVCFHSERRTIRYCSHFRVLRLVGNSNLIFAAPTLKSTECSEFLM